MRRTRTFFLPALFLLLIVFGLSACSTLKQPSNNLLIDALKLEIELTQASLVQSLDIEFDGNAVVTNVRVDSDELVKSGAENIHHISGKFDWKINPSFKSVDNIFELFLRQHNNDLSWQLLKPIISSDKSYQDWISFPIYKDIVG